jgi:hypothetical protein
MGSKGRFLMGFVVGVLSSAIIGGLIFFYANKYYYNWIYTHQTIKLGSGDIEEGLIDKIKKQIFALPLQASSKWEKLDKVWMILQNQYYDTKMLDEDKMKEDAIKGFVSAI